MKDRRVVVSTECPTCGAPLDFSEGSNAVRCTHCRSNLLATGRGQVLSYWIPSRVPMEKARAQAALALRRAKREVRSLDPELCFLPFYRMTAQDFMWVKPEPKPLPLTDVSGDDAATVLGWGRWSSSSMRGEAALDLISLAGDLIGEMLSSRSAPAPSASPGPVPPPLRQPPVRHYEEVEFAHQHVEKNFIGATLPGADLVSIGVRSSVLRLQLFDRAVVSAAGTVIAPDLDAAAAWRRGLMLQRERVIYRQTLGARLSVIYFPYWILRHAGAQGAHLLVVDGISGGVVNADASAEMLSAVRDRAQTTAATVSFRPLVCPNCGWDLPVRDADAIFYCASCHRAWLFEGSELRRVPHSVAAPAAGGQAMKYLPFWRLQSDQRQLIVPAFRYRQLKHLQMLASRLARVPQAIEPGDEPATDVLGGFYDAEDAARLALFALAGVTLEEGRRVESEPALSGASLVWVPFRSQGNYLFDPFFGMNLFANLLG